MANPKLAFKIKSEMDLCTGGLHSDFLGIVEQYDLEDTYAILEAIRKALWIGYCRGFEDCKDVL